MNGSLERATLDAVEPSASERLIDAIQDLSLAQDLDAIRTIVRRTARELTGADGATFVLRDSGLCHYLDEDAIGPLWKGRRFPMEICISGWAMVHRQAVAVEDIYADARIPADAYRPTFVKSLVMVPIRTADPIGAIGNYWATAHRASQEEIRNLQALADATAAAMERVRVYQELEQRVCERTSELETANQRLAVEIQERCEAEQTLQTQEAQARRMRLERDQLAWMLASGIAHELNQPLSAAIAYVDAALRLLRREGGDCTQAIEAMEKATAQNWRAVAVVRQFRELLRRGEPDLRPCDLNELMRSAAELAEEQARELGFALGLDLDPDLGRVRCDRSQIEHVVLNLLRNALEAMRDEGAARGSVVVRVRPGRPGFARTSIADDGPGLSCDARRNLFAPFHTTKETGLGLGLSVSRTIVEAHGGELWADSNERNGATFHFTLPLSSS
ncbi:MAG: GAF domain-containing protein [Gammaproteobacteria bacterium]|nr:GAF domain-containing protein [Gammaproteobacteria bacterium]